MTLRVLKPDSPAYEACLAELANGAAAAAQPAAIVQPRNTAEVGAAMAIAQREGLSLSVRGGGHSRFCAQTGSLMLDLASNLNQIRVQGDQVWVQGGACMGSLLNTLATAGRMIPVGTHATPGFGLLTMGGVGHLSRSLGLTLDAVQELKGIRADGVPFVASAQTDDSDLWALLRGGAVFLAVITEATLRTFPRRRLQVQRCLQPLESLEAELAAAEALPRQAACSFILGVPPGEQGAAVLRFAVAAEEHAPCLQPLGQPNGAWSQVVGGLEELPAFELPARDGSIPSLPAAGDRHQRARTWVYSISLPRGRVAALAQVLQQALSAAPNRDCRVDLQHVGGADGDVPIGATAYRGRHAEWSIVITAVWAARDITDGKQARTWAEAVFDALVPLANHYYIVQRHPGTERYATELCLAYGPMLEPLRSRKRAWDPHNKLPSLDAKPEEMPRNAPPPPPADSGLSH